MKDHEILDEAADLIDRYGWVQRDYGAIDRGFCAIGALGAVVRRERCTFQGVDRIFGFLRATIGINGQPTLTIMSWNDEPGRTQDQVTTALREAAKDAWKRELNHGA